MGILEQPRFLALNDPSDPDDWRPSSRLAFAVDPGPNPVRSLCVILEDVAPGDRIPLHTHPHDEAIVYEVGQAEVVLGDETRRVAPGAVVFVPAGTPHGTRNVGADVLRLRASFPTDVIEITYLERNPAPGTEGDPPQPPARLDVRALGEPAG